MVPATSDATGSLLSCQTPHLRSSAISAYEPLEVTLNGQQFSSGGAVFQFYGVPRVSIVSPVSGPLTGGTLITLLGQSLGG